MKRRWILLMLAGLPLTLFGQEDADAILKKVDANLSAHSRIHTATMVIHGRRGTRTMTSKSWIVGTEKSFTEFLSPAREAGTKMLKLGDELWTYSPSTDRTIRIAGHMLRQSVMGSDLSYEDAMEDPHLPNLYTASLAGEDTVLDQPCWRLRLEAKTPDIAYNSREIWVDKQHYTVLKESRYAKSGKLLKTAEVLEVKFMDGRWVATRMRFKDALKEGEGTEFLIDDVVFNADIPPQRFSKAALKR